MEEIAEPTVAQITVDEKGKADQPKERLLGASKLRAIHVKFCDDDEKSERNRAKIQDLKDYKPPLRADLLRRAGQKGRFNLNLGQVGSLLNEASSMYIDSFESPEHLVPVTLQRNKYDEVQKLMHERVMSDEFTRMVRGWDSSYFVYLTMVDQFITQGLCVGFFMDRHTWMFDGAGLREFKFPRKTKACADGIEMCTYEGQYGKAKLSDIIQDEEIATNAGWDVKEVKRVLSSTEYNPLYDDEKAEDMQEKMKANDLDEEAGEFAPINIIHAWVKEYDGTVSYYITTKTAKTVAEHMNKEPDAYLYKKLNAYSHFGEALQLFPFHVGNKGNIYTIRGMGFMVYGIGMAANTMHCSLLDSAKDSMSVKYIAPSEREIGSMPIVNAGPATFIPAHLQVVDKQYQPDLQKSAMPAIQLLKGELDSRSASSTVSGVFQNKQDRRSAEEVSSALEHFNSLNSASQLLWSHPWRALLSESVMRAFAPIQDESQKCGRLAMIMQQACIDRGVPPEAFELIDRHATKTSIPVGAGGKAARGAAFDAGASLYTAMDDKGRQNFNRDRAIHHFGVEKAKRYMNFEEAPRELVDHQLAILETNDLITGQWIEPTNSEVYVVHLRVHIAKLEEAMQAVEEGEVELIEATQEMELLHQHAVKSLQLAVVPDQQVEELELFEQKLQQIGEFISNGQRAIQKLEREQELQPEAQGEDPNADKKAESALKLELETVKGQMDIQKKDFENKLDSQARLAELQHKDDLHAQKLAHNEMEAIARQAEIRREAAAKQNKKAD
jgi:hypothetical protein